jgi:VRR-NUC domain-containing protein
VSPRISSAEFKALARGKPLPRPETDVVRAILLYLAMVPGVTAWCMNSRVVFLPGKKGRMRPVRFGVPGIPDIYGWRAPGGRTLAIEVKRPTEKRVRRDQEIFLARVAAAGGIALVARSVDDVAKVIR